MTRLFRWTAVFGWSLLVLSVLFVFFTLAIVLGNGSEYDCELSTLASAGRLFLVSGLLGFGIAAGIQKFRFRRRLRNVAVTFFILVLAEAGLILNQTSYDRDNACEDPDQGPRSGNPLARVHAGMDESEAIRILGKPDSVRPCLWKFVRYPGPGCDHALVYNEAGLAFLRIAHPVVFVDAKGRVLWTKTYRPPLR